MPDYKNGKIYKLWSEHTDKIYIGSTCNSLSKRLNQHKCCTFTTSRELFELGEVKIELIENFPCNSKEELSAREAHYIRTLNCINRCIPGRTQKECYQDKREEKIQKAKEYFNKNKEELEIKRKKKFICECGGSYSITSKGKHMKTEKHKNYCKTLVLEE